MRKQRERKQRIPMTKRERLVWRQSLMEGPGRYGEKENRACG